MADPHLGKFWKSNNSVFSRAKKLIDYFVLNLEEASRLYNRPHLVILGDMFDSVSANIEMLVYIKHKLTKLYNLFQDIYVIAGNHETFIDKEGVQQTLLYVALDTNRVHLYTSRVAHECIEGKNFIFVPHQTEIEDKLKNDVPLHLNRNMSNILLSHTTPKEIFSYCKYSLNELLDSYPCKMEYVLLGHYHMPVDYTYKGCKVISVGNMYYTSIAEIKSDLTKRYMVLNEDGKLIEHDIVLPDVYKFEVLDQTMFDNVVLKQIKEQIRSNTKAIIYITSKNIIDYSSLTFEGYDVYFDLVESAEEALITLKESISGDVDLGTSGTLTDRWNKYLEMLSGNLSTNELHTINWLFNHRTSSQIEPKTVVHQLQEGKDE